MSATHTIVPHDAAIKRISEVLAIVAMALLLLYLVDAVLDFLAQSRYLPISVNTRGIIFGGGSLTLFILSNAILFMTKVPSKLAPCLLLAGGIIIANSVIISAAIPDVKTPASIITIAILGYVIAGFGAFWLFRLSKISLVRSEK